MRRAEGLERVPPHSNRGIPREHEVGKSIGINSLLGGLGDAEGLFRDMRQRLIAEVESGASRRAAAEEFAVSASTAIIWVKCFRETGRCAAEPGVGVSRRWKSMRIFC